jgi:hypothetical protein
MIVDGIKYNKVVQFLEEANYNKSEVIKILKRMEVPAKVMEWYKNGKKITKVMKFEKEIKLLLKNGYTKGAILELLKELEVPRRIVSCCIDYMSTLPAEVEI